MAKSGTQGVEFSCRINGHGGFPVTGHGSSGPEEKKNGQYCRRQDKDRDLVFFCNRQCQAVFLWAQGHTFHAADAFRAANGVFIRYGDGCRTGLVTLLAVYAQVFIAFDL